MAEIIDEIMDFDPSQVVTVFTDSQDKPKGNPNVYKTNPKDSVSEDGHYHSKVRVLLNPYNIKRSIVHQVNYAMKDERGFFMVKSALSVGDKNCPIFKGWKSLHFSGDPERDEWAKKMFDKSESDWVLVQVIEDENQPEAVGMFKVMKLPKIILSRMEAKMNPADPKKQKQPLMDYLFGPVLEIDVRPGEGSTQEERNRSIKYDLCDFDTDPCPVIQRDGTPLLTDEELETVEEYWDAQVNILKAKTDAKRNEAQAKKEGLRDELRAIYAKVTDYLKANAINLELECSYQPWDDATAKRVQEWLDKVLNMQDPVIQTVNEGTAVTVVEEPQPTKVIESKPTTTEQQPVFNADNDDLPF